MFIETNPYEELMLTACNDSDLNIAVILTDGTPRIRFAEMLIERLEGYYIYCKPEGWIQLENKSKIWIFNESSFPIGTIGHMFDAVFADVRIHDLDRIIEYSSYAWNRLLPFKINLRIYNV